MQTLLGTSLSLEQLLVLKLSPLMLAAVCILGPVILAYLGLLLTRKLVSPEYLRQHHDVTGPFFGTLGTVYGVFLAFIVATTWQFYSTTGSNVVEEARNLSELYSDASAFPSPFKEQIQGLLREYRTAVVTREWKSLELGESDPETSKLLRQIENAYASHKVADPTEGVFFHESVRSLNQMQDLRSSRIDDSCTGLVPFLWCVLLAGGAVTIGFSFLFGAQNFTAQAAMTMLLTAIVAMTLYTIVNLDFPFSGLVAISSEPFEKVDLK
ncbi:hypothetical protein BH09VER1_BH09VER1_33260 [soil metagenome]